MVGRVATVTATRDVKAVDRPKPAMFDNAALRDAQAVYCGCRTQSAISLMRARLPSQSTPGKT